PFEKLVEELAPERDLSRAPLVQVLLVLQNAPSAPLRLPGVTLAGAEAVELGTAKLDLSLNVRQDGNDLVGWWMCNSDLFDPATVDRFHERFATLLAGVLADPGRLLQDLPLLPEAEREQVLAWAGSAEGGRGEIGDLSEAFTARAAVAPEAVAVAGEGGALL